MDNKGSDQHVHSHSLSFCSIWSGSALFAKCPFRVFRLQCINFPLAEYSEASVRTVLDLHWLHMVQGLYSHVTNHIAYIIRKPTKMHMHIYVIWPKPNMSRIPQTVLYLPYTLDYRILRVSLHYENTMPIQIYRKFHLKKMKIFR